LRPLQPAPAAAPKDEWQTVKEKKKENSKKEDKKDVSKVKEEAKAPPPKPKPKVSLIGPPPLDWTSKFNEYIETQRRLGLPVPDEMMSRKANDGPARQPTLPSRDSTGFTPPAGGWRRSGKFWLPPVKDLTKKKEDANENVKVEEGKPRKPERKTVKQKQQEAAAAAAAASDPEVDSASASASASTKKEEKPEEDPPALKEEKKEGKGDVITLAYNKDLAEQFNDALKYLLANNLVVGHENVAPEMYDLEIAVFIKKARQQARRKLQEEEN